MDPGSLTAQSGKWGKDKWQAETITILQTQGIKYNPTPRNCVAPAGINKHSTFNNI